MGSAQIKSSAAITEIDN